MFDSTILNVAIGLILIFLLYSLLASSLHEAIATILAARAQTLSDGILSMLTNTERDKGLLKTFRLYLYNGLKQAAKWVVYIFKAKTDNTLHEKFYAHPIIKNYGSSVLFKKPSYLSPQNFSAILIDTLKNLEHANKDKTATLPMLKLILDNTSLKIIQEEVRTILKLHLNESGGDIEVFKHRLESWYNDTMDRVSGWYKRTTQFSLFFIGLFLAISVNIDTIEIANQLSVNKVAAAQLASMGTAVAGNQALNPKDTNAISDQALKEIHKNLDTVNNLLGLGWGLYKKDTPYILSLPHISEPNWITSVWSHVPILGKTASAHAAIYKDMTGFKQHLPLPDSLVIRQMQPYFTNNDPYYRWWYIWHKLFTAKLFGFLITAMAIGLGAPFWFDLLSKFVNLRTAGKAINPSGNSTPGNTASDNNQIDG